MKLAGSDASLRFNARGFIIYKSKRTLKFANNELWRGMCINNSCISYNTCLAIIQIGKYHAHKPAVNSLGMVLGRDPLHS